MKAVLLMNLNNMKSLFEIEEKENSKSQLIIDLLSRYYHFSSEELYQYIPILNIDRHHLMMNDSVDWDHKLFEILKDDLDWKSIHVLKSAVFDFDFFKKHGEHIDFNTIHISKNIKWSKELLHEFGDKFDWSKWLIIEKPLSCIDNLRRFKDRLNWEIISQYINIEFDESVLNEFSDKWNWVKLSSNTSLPVTTEFVQRYSDKLDFNALSQNPKSIDLIYRYPNAKHWNWDKIIINRGIVYNKESFDLIFKKFKSHHEAKEFSNPTLKKMALPSFLFTVFMHQQNDINFFLNDAFIKCLPWRSLCKYCKTELSMSFIEKHKDLLNFRESEFISHNSDIISTDFIKTNLDLFDTEHHSFYKLPLTIEIINKYNDKINWRYLSSCKKLDWNWEFINIHYEKFDWSRLSENQGIFEKLILNLMSKENIIDFLDIELINKRN